MEYRLPKEEGFSLNLSSANIGNITRFINHSADHSNVKYKAENYQGINYVVFRSKKLIPRNSELLINYGCNYWIWQKHLFGITCK